MTQSNIHPQHNNTVTVSNKLSIITDSKSNMSLKPLIREHKRKLQFMLDKFIHLYIHLFQ